MPFSDNIEYLMSHPGAVAVLVCQVGEPLILDLDLNDTRFSGVASWRNVLADALSMLDDSGETFVSAVVGEHSILAETRDGQQCAVVYPTGHAASKVMRRMLRHAAGPKRTMRKVESRKSEGGKP
jgi:hypothetical protein